MMRMHRHTILVVLWVCVLLRSSLVLPLANDHDGSPPTESPKVTHFWLSCPHKAAYNGELSIPERLLAGQPYRSAQHHVDLDHYPTEDPSHTYGRRSTTPPPVPVAYPHTVSRITADRYRTTPRVSAHVLNPAYSEMGTSNVRHSLTADVEILRYTENGDPEYPGQVTCGGGESDCLYTVSGHIKLNQRIIKAQSVINTARGRGIVDINKRTSVSLCLSSPVNQELLLEISVMSIAETGTNQNSYQEAEDQYSRDRYARSAHLVRYLARRQAPSGAVKKFDCLVELPADIFHEGYQPQWQTPRCTAHPSISGQNNEELLFRYVVYQTDSEACNSDNIQAGDWTPLNG
ncbi:uncharacterized protein LOC129581779 [Paramacrobiotus metropolitanus]|uniref:uncharacterized protein LOC129581779 n=1 Tax=Paramacrobiotus metropolitanus TaxID=2943436 RepID=UPI00244581D5|nr:uncharacterized protein LOC129581779 [Paramacrobiotus metropolitanus]